ncbi:alkaline phosphatase D family protein [Jiangella rhizosphaerae]|uniref:Alkaline phosphatase family protein n=1 Tax=Jiangella rhizosphaerae TaxID=2293569 RepID=A0A418KJB4_9ACTN|nr:alkaline phosphatase D family protein [Jiangella rhizosphaerae]RIQ14348.1 alkaline phosphatase family protein [Jiangella rhizosphaerae]
MSAEEAPLPGTLVLGPLLRHVDHTSALIWVETDRPATVGVLGATARTFTVHGHHYALVAVDGLEPGTSTPYAVDVDGERVWPEPGSPFPPPVIRTRGDGRVRLTFGSCRMSVPHDAKHDRVYGTDALRALALTLAAADEADRPDGLVLLGDQVYADETSDAMREFIGARRDVSQPPGTEVADFEEYAYLYRLAWTDPAVRWLLSTVPAAMIFDDHDIRDDWNTSQAWRERMAGEPWWRRRITGGIAAYWLYQHVGNLSPSERAADPVLAAVTEVSGDAGAVLDEFAWQADQEPASYRWSFTRDIGPARLVMIDSRCGRMLDPEKRTIVDDAEWDWIAGQVRDTEHVEHLFIGTSLPYLLPRGLHDLEAWNEATAAGAWGARFARAAETLRQAVDLEHWAAFGRSFTAMADLVTDVATGPDGRRPRAIGFLSGDVHYSYAARLDYPGRTPQTSSVYQLVCSPVRNPLSRTLRYLNGAAAFAVARVAGTGLARLARVPKPRVTWSVEAGPRFDNALATLELTDGTARVRWETGRVDGDVATMSEVLSAEL